MMDKVAALQKLRADWYECTKCPAAANTITNKVFGEGNVNAKIFIVGMGPGEEEDKQGRAFVGPSGGMLNKYFETLQHEGLNITREQLFITNLVCCRTVTVDGFRAINRDPTNEECTNCSERLFSEIYIVDPVLIVTLGTLAFKKLTKKTNLAKLRGQVIMAKIPGKARKEIEYPALGSWHPSYLLRKVSMEEGSPRHNLYQDLKRAVSLVNFYTQEQEKCS